MVEIDYPVDITLSLVPDKLSAEHQSIRNYLRDACSKTWDSPDHMILSMIEDINNALVPKWLEVIYEKDGVTLRVEDRQPGLESKDLP